MNTRKVDEDKKNNFLNDLKKHEQEKKLLDTLTRKSDLNTNDTFT